MEKAEKKICWYGALLITLFVNSGKLLALRENGILARYWHFNIGELCFQALYDLLFCLLLFYLNVGDGSFFRRMLNQRGRLLFFLSNTAVVIAMLVLGAMIQLSAFPGSNRPPLLYWAGYSARIGLSAVLSGIIVKIIHLTRASKEKEVENEKLKGAYSAAELELLKAQINPHFLFNAFSSLSAVIHENPVLAQNYVRELSKVFRYSLIRSHANLVTLEQELLILRSFAELVRMRLENAFELHIQVDKQFLSWELPHLSLQPLLENAVKHNGASLQRPLTVTINVQSEQLVVRNNIWTIPNPESSNGLGLANLNERFKMMLHREIDILEDDNQFTVKLPLRP